MRDLKWLPVQRLLVRVISDADDAIEDEVHFEDFLLLVVDDIFLLFLAEVARLETEGNIVQELAILVGLRVEEETEVVEDVIEQVVHDDATFDLPGQRIDELIILLDLAEAVVLPEVLEVLIDLPIETIWQWLVPESSQQSHPVVQVKCLLLISQVLVESGNDLDEATHDVGEEGHAGKHNEDAEDHLVARLG